MLVSFNSKIPHLSLTQGAFKCEFPQGMFLVLQAILFPRKQDPAKWVSQQQHLTLGSPPPSRVSSAIFVRPARPQAKKPDQLKTPSQVHFLKAARVGNGHFLTAPGRDAGRNRFLQNLSALKPEPDCVEQEAGEL